MTSFREGSDERQREKEPAARILYSFQIRAQAGSPTGGERGPGHLRVFVKNRFGERA